MSPRNVKIVLICIALALSFAMLCTTDESDADETEIILEGDLTDTARFYLTSDYRLYFEGTGEVVCDTEKWLDYYYYICELHVSDGITSVETDDLQYYYSLVSIYLGKDLERFNSLAQIERLIFENGCGDVKSISCWFPPGQVIIEGDLISELKDRYTEIYLRSVPSSEVPKEDRNYVGVGQVIELKIGDLDTFEGLVQLGIFYGAPETSVIVSHLQPRYDIDHWGEHWVTKFKCNQTGLFVLKQDVQPLIPHSEEIAAVLAVLITVVAILYYRRVTKKVE